MSYTYHGCSTLMRPNKVTERSPRMSQPGWYAFAHGKWSQRRVGVKLSLSSWSKPFLLTRSIFFDLQSATRKKEKGFDKGKTRQSKTRKYHFDRRRRTRTGKQHCDWPNRQNGRGIVKICFFCASFRNNLVELKLFEIIYFAISKIHHDCQFLEQFYDATVNLFLTNRAARRDFKSFSKLLLRSLLASST